MARLNLQTKGTDLTIERKISSQDTTYIPMNDPSNFYLLKDNRCEEEKFSRVCKHFVNHYFKVGTEWLREKIFYPSAFGFEEIETENDHPYIEMRNKLRKEGIGLVGERSTPKIYQKQGRIKLKSRPQRMTLTCKEED